MSGSGMILCRLCGEKTLDPVKVFSKDGLKRKISEKTLACLKISVTANDGLPKIICQQCTKKLDEFYIFFEKATKTQNYLELIYIPPNERSIKNEFIEFEALVDPINPTENQKETVAKKNTEKVVEDKELKRKKLNIRFSKIFRDYPWTCALCESEVFESHQELGLHYSEEHNSSPVYKCIQCEKMYEKLDNFRKHWVYHTSTHKYECTVCEKSFKLKSALTTHSYVHEKNRPHSCSICQKTFKRLTHLAVHTKLHASTEERMKYPCKLCEKVFLQKQSLIAHEKMHKGERDFICDICGKTFVTKSSLVYHISSHSLDRNYECSLCDLKCRTPILLARHFKIHSAIKPHRCDTCGKEFREKSALSIHNRIHTGALPYTCEYCGKSFRFSGIFTVHKRQHTGEKPYACVICDRSFTNWPNYNKHMKRIHKQDTSNLAKKKKPTAEQTTSEDIPTNNIQVLKIVGL